MKRFFLFLIPLTVIMNLSLAQQKVKIDSLKGLLERAKEDTSKIKFLNEIGYSYRDIDPDSGLHYCRQAMLLAKRIRFYDGLSTSYSNTGVNLLHLSKYIEAIENFEASLSIERTMGDELGTAIALGNMGNAYKYLSNYPKATDCYLKAIKIYEKLNDESRRGVALGCLGLLYLDLGDYNRALDYLHKELAVHQRMGNKYQVGRVLMNLGGVYGYRKDYSESLRYFQMALQTNKETGNELAVATCIGDIGTVYDDMRDYKNAIECHRKSIVLLEALNAPYNLGVQLKALGMSYCNADDDVLKMCSIKPADRFVIASKLITQSIEIAKTMGSFLLEEEGWIGLTDLYEKQNNFKKALESHKQYAAIHDSILNDAKKEEMTKSELKYEYDKKQIAEKATQDKKDIITQARLKREKTLRNSFASVGVVILATSFVSFRFYKRRRDAQQKQREAEQKEKETAAALKISEAELTALRLQINPHFLYNTLQSIQQFVSEHRPEEAEGYLEEFSKLMRDVLESSRHDEVSLSRELATLERYMQLENLRMPLPFDYAIDIESGIDPESVFLPPNILQPFIENAIKHGLWPKRSAGFIRISVQKEGEDLHIIIEDDGVGRKPVVMGASAVFTHRSLGMKITEERLGNLNKMKNSNAGFRITDLIKNGSPSGTLVELNLPLEV